MTEIKRIQIFGERCSGTNFLESLIRGNIKGVNLCSDFGYKHFFYSQGEKNSDDCLFLIIYRHPFDWLRSISRKAWHVADELKNCSFSEFIRKEWHCVYNEESGTSSNNPEYGKEMTFERDPETGQRFKNVIKMRTRKIENFESIKETEKSTYYMKHEDLASDPEAFIKVISRQYNLKKRMIFRPVILRKGKRGIGIRFYKAKQSYPIIEEDRQYILENLSLELEKKIGYHL